MSLFKVITGDPIGTAKPRICLQFLGVGPPMRGSDSCLNNNRTPRWRTTRVRRIIVGRAEQPVGQCLVVSSARTGFGWGLKGSIAT